MLDREFKASGGEWGKCDLGELFHIHSPKKKFNANKLSFTGEYPYVARTSNNNGIRGYINKSEEYLNPGLTISFGQDTATMFFQKDAYFTGDKIKILSLKDRTLNSSIASFLISLMKKSFSTFSWGSSSFDEKILKKVQIMIPQINNAPAWSYMENYIEELEAERIEELEAYLRVTGLIDNKLTANEEKLISLLDNCDELCGGLVRPENRSLRIGDVFNISAGKRTFHANALTFGGYFPYVTRTENNNGIRGYIDENEDYLNPGDSISFGQDTATFFYQKSPYFNGRDIKVIQPKEFGFNRYNALYTVTVMRKSFCNFSWGETFNMSRVNDVLVSLPVKGSTVDIKYMEAAIRAIEKLVITDVTNWATEKINALKVIVADGRRRVESASGGVENGRAHRALAAPQDSLR
ncbi:TPA: type II restriction endonuclease [Salmonella enterica]|nr:type II restriction endonuclease [Salmonella enterica]